MKKLIAIMLALICVIGVFAGCSGNQGDDNKKDDDKKGNGEIINIGIPVNMMIEDYDTNALTLWIEEQTGYDLVFKTYASSPADYKTQLSTQILDPSVSLPDMIIHMPDLGDAAWQTYGEDGYFIDLTDYLMDKEGKAKNWWDMAESVFTQAHIKAAIDRCRADDGKIYSYPTMERGVVDSLPYIAHINKAWLEKINMPAPTNPDELYTVLKAFKEQCCEGKGYWPMLSAGSSVLGSDGIWWIISMFCPGYSYDNYFSLSEDGKKLTTPFTTEEYRQALIYVRKLMSEGLLPDNTFNIDIKDYRAILNDDDGAKCGVIVFHTTPAFNDVNNPNLYEYIPLDLYGFCQSGYGGTFRGTFITEQAEIDGKVDACWDILMLLCTKEGTIRLRYGDEEINWTWVEEGSDVKSYLGFDCWINLIDDPFSRPNNEMWGVPAPTVNPQAEGEFVNPGTMSEWMQYRYYLNGEGYKNFSKYEAQNKYTFPELVMTPEEDDATKYERQNTQNALKTWMTKFCKDASIDPSNPAHWQAYLDELNQKGLQTWLNQYQTIYEERYMAEVLAEAK